MNLDDRYLLWQPVSSPRQYAVTRFDDAFLRRPPGPLAGVWPEGAFAVLDAERGGKSPILPDSLMTKARRLLVSPRLKGYLERGRVPEVEYWPLKIIDRTGRALGDPFFYVHFLNLPDCLDLEASGATRSRILPGIAEQVERLVFQSDPARPLCRPLTFGQVTLVDWPLAEALACEGFSGFRFMGLFDYGRKGDLPPDPRRRKVDELCLRLQRRPLPGL